MSSTQFPKVSYIPSLDGIRALSVLLVLVSHAGLGHVVPGGLGVTVFFFLSGFLITTLLVQEFYNEGRVSIRNFYLRRFFRLFPPLAVTLLIAYSLVAFDYADGGVSFSGLFYQVFYLANYQSIFNWAAETPKGLGILWSLAVEEHFYIFFPFLMQLSLGRIGIVGTARCLMLVCLVVLLWRYYLVLVHEVNEIRTYYATDTRIDSIIYGCILALVSNPVYKKETTRISVSAWFVLGCAVALMLVTLLYRDDVFRETLRYSLQGVALLPLFYCAIIHHRSWCFSWLDNAILKKLGVYSYSIYLIHHFIIGMIERYLGQINVFLNILCALLFSVIFAFMVDKYVEAYFKKLRARFR